MECPYLITIILLKMNLGAFSVSLNVGNLGDSKQFYQALGFKIVGGNENQKYLIMRNQQITIGLFQDMLKSNVLTFNPGWDQDCNILEIYDDIRTIQKGLKNKGVQFLNEANEHSQGPASCMLADPDGNLILIDQHI